MSKFQNYNEAKKSQVQQVFGQHAKNYVESPIFSAGYSLKRLLELLQPQPGWRVLDIATGGGHTAVNFAQQGAWTIASDLTFPMLHAARVYHTNAAVPLHYVQNDAENLPFASASFDIITCRIAAHHFPQVPRFVAESARLLKPSGYLGMVDIISPENQQAARYCNLFETLRDRSHVWAYSLSDWERFFQEANLVITMKERFVLSQQVGEWARRVGCDEVTIQRLRVMMLQSPRPIRAWYELQATPGWSPLADIAFSIQQAILIGQKK